MSAAIPRTAAASPPNSNAAPSLLENFILPSDNNSAVTPTTVSFTLPTKISLEPEAVITVVFIVTVAPE
jgi:hypothetical protein